MLWRSLIPAIVWALFIALLSGVPGKSLPNVNFWELLNFDKIAHFTVYAILSYLTAIGLHKQHTHRKIRYYGKWFAMLFVIPYGFLLELLQFTVFTGRTFEWFDAIANTAGCLFGILIFSLIFDKVLKNN